MPTIISITEDPSGPVYRHLLRFALERCNAFSLVWRDDVNHARSASETESRLSPYRAELARTSRWPGTEHVGYKARLVTHSLTSKSMSLLMRAADSLFAWKPPELPEDLTFYTPEKECWLVTISRTQQAYFVGSNLKVEIVEDVCPGIQVKAEEVGPQRYRLLKPDRSLRPPLLGD